MTEGARAPSAQAHNGIGLRRHREPVASPVLCGGCGNRISPSPDTNFIRLWFRCGNLLCPEYHRDQAHLPPMLVSEWFDSQDVSSVAPPPETETTNGDRDALTFVSTVLRAAVNQGEGDELAQWFRPAYLLEVANVVDRLSKALHGETP